jgi:hypothetical protein
MAAPHVAGVAALILEKYYSTYEDKLDANTQVQNEMIANASFDILGPCCGRQDWWQDTPNIFLNTKFLFNPLINSEIPIISGVSGVGQTLTTSNGVWVGSPAPKFTFQWSICDSKLDADTCSTINGATKNSLKLLPNQVGKSIRVRVVATNSLASNSAISLGTDLVSAPPTVATPSLTVTGTAAVGQALAYSTSSLWNGFPTVTPSYQWYRCLKAVNAAKVLNTTPLRDCTAIDGATSSPYTLVSADSGTFITVASTGTNTGGTLVLWAKSTTAVGSIPFNSTRPTMSSSTNFFAVGSTITATSTAAHWTGSPIPKLTFQWQKYVDSTWVPITGATKNTFKLTTNETGFDIRVAVTGTNIHGPTTAFSELRTVG